ncbi:hypothetical protein K523DRAFT_411906 [Schizophyllum commune Tattone D]|nr:hypothetical protein K523DRAFT_411906 [Schizophyllum commune Tattone D]
MYRGGGPASTFPYKKYQCRHYDRQTGRPLRGPCINAGNCRFVHPTDSNWPGVEPASSKRANENGARPPSGTPQHQASPSGHEGASSPRANRFATPLPPQNSAFTRYSGRPDDVPARRGRSVDIGRGVDRDREYDRERERERERERDRRHRGRSYERGMDRRDLANVKMESDAERGRLLRESPKGPPPPPRAYSRERIVERRGRTPPPPPPLNRDFVPRHQEMPPPEDPRMPPRSSLAPRMSPERRPPPPAPLPSTPAPAPAANPETRRFPPVTQAAQLDKLGQLFRRIAEISHDTSASLATLSSTQAKLDTYTSISSTLAKISPAASSSIDPVIADVLLSNVDAKGKIDQGVLDVKRVWQDIWSVVEASVNDIVKARVARETDVLARAAVEEVSRVRAEADRAIRALEQEMDGHLRRLRAAAPNGAPPSGRRASDAHYDNRKRFREGEDGFDARGHALATPDAKRRRVDEDGRGVNSPSTPAGQDPALQAMLEDMRAKMNAQAEALKSLERENSQLKTTLKKPAAEGNGNGKGDWTNGSPNKFEEAPAKA